jgi:hypothetical protein
MATATTAATLGGSPRQTLVRCNRCNGSGIWRGQGLYAGKSGTCFACKGGGLLEAERAEAYLTRMGPAGSPVEPPAEKALRLATEACAKARAEGWVMLDPVQFPDRVELIGRNPRRAGKTVHLTWEVATGTRHQEWLEGPPSRHRDLLAEEA